MHTAYEDVLAQAEQLPLNECLMLIEQLARKIRLSGGKSVPRPRWEDAAGIAPYPLCNEDAQTWVTKSRAGCEALKGE